MAWPRSFRHASPAVCKPAGSSQQWLLIVRKMSKIALVSHNGWRYSLLKSTVTEAVPLANSIIGMIHPSIMITVRFSCVIQRGRRGKTNHSPAHPLLKPFSFSSPPPQAVFLRLISFSLSLHSSIFPPNSSPAIAHPAFFALVSVHLLFICLGVRGEIAFPRFLILSIPPPTRPSPLSYSAIQPTHPFSPVLSLDN